MTTDRRRPIEVAGLTTLMVPTVRRPAYGRAVMPGPNEYSYLNGHCRDNYVVDRHSRSVPQFCPS
jgi:hypothetical protein